MSTLRCFLLEDQKAAEDGVGAYDALSAVVKRHGGVLTPRRFHDRDSFLDRLMEAVGEAQSGPMLLVISAHGAEATGTWIDAKAGAFSAFEVMHQVPARPADMVVYLSSCWGAYPDLPLALQWRSDPAPLVLGPLVEIEAIHADGFQDELVGLVASAANEADLVALVGRWNAKLSGQYGGDVFAIVRRDGSRIPDWGTRGFAGKQLQDMDVHVVALQRSPALVRTLLGSIARADEREMAVVAESDDADIVVLEDGRRQLWLVRAGHFDPDLLALGTTLRVDATRKHKPEHPKKPALVGALVEIDNVRPTGFKKVKHRYKHALSGPKAVEHHSGIPAEAAGECIRCCWGVVGRRQEQRFGDDGKESIVDVAQCHCTKQWGTCRVHDLLL